jgi:murein peptide amidase A
MLLNFDGSHNFGVPKLVNKHTVLAFVLLSCLLYAGFFALSKQVSFSYAHTTCTREVTLFPALHRAVGDSGLTLEYRDGLKVGNAPLASTSVCFIPEAAPKKGFVDVSGAPFGSWLFRSHYRVGVGEAPKVLGASTQPAQALSQPLKLRLSQPDRVFRYYLTTGGKAQLCQVASSHLACGVDQLGLTQGATHTLMLQRRFEDRPAGDTQGVQVAILPATKVTASIPMPEETVYSKPKAAEITLDKPLAAATATLELVNGNAFTPVNAQVTVAGAKVLVNWNEDLPRERTLRLVLRTATASDGSRLDGAYAVQFRTSGGPRVVGVSIGGSGVAGNARVVVTFDQALASNANVTGLAGISGGGASISRQGNNQVVFALRDLPRCAPFTLSIAKGLLSESGIASTQDWAHASRIMCRTTRTIGYSVRGRPIVAYFYGSGPSTVLFTGGIHGNERSSTYIMDDWVAHLDANAHRIPAGRQVVVVPNVNPDGIAINQRYNAHNVNLDRNFPSSDWISDIGLSNGQVLPQGGGPTPLSEPEARALADLANGLQLRASISFHASGSVVSANKVADSTAIATLYARSVGYDTVFANPEATFGYTLTGELETWVGEKFGTPAILIELPTATGRFFSRHQGVLWTMVNL